MREFMSSPTRPAAPRLYAEVLMTVMLKPMHDSGLETVFPAVFPFHVGSNIVVESDLVRHG